MNNLKGAMIYLCGPMDRCPEGGIVWRQKITPELKKMGVIVTDPTNKPCPVKEDPLIREKITRLKHEEKWDEVVGVMKEIVRVDLRLTAKSDALIVYIDTDIFMCGTMHEIAVAAQNRLPILLVCKQGKSEIPNWLFGIIPHDTMFNNFDELMEYLRKVDCTNLENDKRWRFFNFS